MSAPGLDAPGMDTLGISGPGAHRLAITAAQSDAHVPERFQRTIIDNMVAALLRQPSPPCLLRAPTGSGKTFMLTGVLAQVTAVTPTLWLWFVPFVNLVQQTEDAILANARGLTPTLLSRGRNQDPQSGMVLLSTAQAVARAKARKAGYAGDGDDDEKTLAELVALARSRGLRIGLVVDEAHIGLDHGTEFGQFAHWLAPDYLLMASATPKDARLSEFLTKAGKGAQEAFTVSRAEVVQARLNKRYIEAVVYDLRHSISGITDLKRTVLRQAWLRHCALKRQLQEAGVELTPLLLVQVGNGDEAVEEAQRYLMQLCKVPPAAIGTHSANEPDPVLMAAIANDHTKQVLIFKQSAGTGFDAPRAFVLASTKPVNDPDFAMQFIGRVMRVAPAIRKAFAKPTPIPAELDTAYIYLANAEAQRGFQSAVDASTAVKSQLEGQTERMVAWQTGSGATVFSNRSTPQMPVSYDTPVPDWESASLPVHAPEATSGPQRALFGAGNDAGEGFDPGTTLMGWDSIVVGPTPPARLAEMLPASEQDLIDELATQGLRAYRRNTALRASPACLQAETRALHSDMARVSRETANSLPLGDALIANAVRAAYNLLREKEVHTELTSGARSEVEVAIVTDRAALLREADAMLRRTSLVEDEDVRIIVGTLAQRLRPHIELPPAEMADAPRDEKQLLRLARDAACWVVCRQAQALIESLQQAVSACAIVEDAAPLPDVMLFPLQYALMPSVKNLYGVHPPDKDEVEPARDSLGIDVQARMSATSLEFVDGRLRAGCYDGFSANNQEERDFAQALDRADFVIWWHRNPNQRAYSVRLVRGDSRNYFYPDFVVCLEHAPGQPPSTRLIETKESTKDAARKSRHIPKVYGKVMFVTKDQNQLRIVNDDGSLGDTFDWDDMQPAKAWLSATSPE